MSLVQNSVSFSLWMTWALTQSMQELLTTPGGSNPEARSTQLILTPRASGKPSPKRAVSVGRNGGPAEATDHGNRRRPGSSCEQHFCRHLMPPSDAVVGVRCQMTAVFEVPPAEE